MGPLIYQLFKKSFEARITWFEFCVEIFLRRDYFCSCYMIIHNVFNKKKVLKN